MSPPPGAYGPVMIDPINLQTLFKAVFQLCVFCTYVHARKYLNDFDITFERSKCFDGANSAFPAVWHALVTLVVKYKLLRRV